MVMNGLMKVVAAMVGAATIAALVSCSSSSTPATSGTTTAAQSASSSTRPAATSAAPRVSATQPQPHDSVGGIDITIAAQGSTTVRPGGPPIHFNVTLVNNGPDIARVGMVVSLGHCSCSPPWAGAPMIPDGSMYMLDTQTNAWVEVPYDTEGSGMDYILQNLVPPFPLVHGQTATYQLKMALDADQDNTVQKGTSAINVTPTDPTDPMRDGFRYTKSLHITVEP
jgi:hypothetical protein